MLNGFRSSLQGFRESCSDATGDDDEVLHGQLHESREGILQEILTTTRARELQTQVPKPATARLLTRSAACRVEPRCQNSHRSSSSAQSRSRLSACSLQVSQFKAGTPATRRSSLTCTPQCLCLWLSPPLFDALSCTETCSLAGSNIKTLNKLP